jgi:hypothetical protein
MSRETEKEAFFQEDNDFKRDKSNATDERIHQK